MNAAMSTAPDPRVVLRPANAAVEQTLLQRGLSRHLAQLLSVRLTQAVEDDCLWAGKLAQLPNPDAIPDMQTAVARLQQAVQQQQVIVLAVDHDMDGQASAAVLWTALVELFGHPAPHLHVLSSHRLREGYGVTAPLVGRILELQPDLVITADKGSSDEPRLAQLRQAGIDVIVTDHHLVPEEGPPASALACVNPARHDSHYDPTICGAAVAFLVMARLRQALANAEPEKSWPKVTELLDYVAVATIADCVSLRPDSAQVNRILVQAGLRRIRQAQRPCWAVFMEAQDGYVDSQDIAFKLAPAVAAAGRLDWAEPGFDFLVSKSRSEAQRAWECLLSENAARKAIEADIRQQAEAQLTQQSLGASICLHLEQGHSGVHGITASRLVERYGRPVALFAPRPDSAGQLSGSLRSIPGLHLRQVLQAVADAHPGLMQRFGGHAGAAGVSLVAESFDAFSVSFEQQCAQALGERDLSPICWVDACLDLGECNEQLARDLENLDPWGRDFPLPQFWLKAQVSELQAMGDGRHARLHLQNASGARLEAVWFQARADAQSAWPVHRDEEVGLVVRVGLNRWRGRERLQIQVVLRADTQPLPASPQTEALPGS